MTTPTGNYGPEANGKYYAMVNIADPANPSSRTTLVAFAPKNYSTGNPITLRVFYRPDGANAAWANLPLTSVADHGIPQIS